MNPSWSPPDSLNLQSSNRHGSLHMPNAPMAPMIDPTLQARYQNYQVSHTSEQQNKSNENPIHESHGLELPNDSSSHRNLPSKEVSEENFDDSYISFIMFCNPSVPLDTNSAGLRQGFRSLPKSDGKSFGPFTLFLLIKRLECKDLKTWTQLCLELGVEAPDYDKGQSSQKIQQYAVRLKRWLHAFHVDAFFQYCLGIPNSYYIDIPEAHEPGSGGPRDGVMPEDDLALRALLPEWRPKRGRRKNDENENDHDNADTRRLPVNLAMRPDSFSASQYSALPQSAYPWSPQSQSSVWTAAQSALAPNPVSIGPVTSHQLDAHASNQQLHWQRNNENMPSASYPQSAITPRHDPRASPGFDEPRSAYPTGSTGSRKRQAISVSTAWPDTSTSASGKPRGRPPKNRTTQDGPFSTFPARPKQIQPNTPVSSASQRIIPATGTLTNTPPQPTNLSQRPSKLQLQVPQNSGGAIRLATPPVVMINGENGHQWRPSGDFFNALDDASENPSDKDVDESGDINWRKRALVLKRKLQEKEDELRDLRRRVIEAVM